MADRDGKYFNCSEEHELNQVCKKYRDKEKVRAFIKEKCRDKTIHYWTYEKLAAYLAENGFQLVKTISLSEFVSGIADKFESGTQAKQAVRAVFDGIMDILKSGNALSIKGFGSFRPEERAGRKGINPATGKEMEIPPMNTVKFTVSHILKKDLNKK